MGKMNDSNTVIDSKACVIGVSGLPVVNASAAAICEFDGSLTP